MSSYTISVSDPWFDHLRQGSKRYEGRLYRGLPIYMRRGDTLTIYRETPDSKETNSFSCIIEDVLRFETFEESMKTLPLDQILPGIKSISEGIKIYETFAKVTTQKQFGVCLIQV